MLDVSKLHEVISLQDVFVAVAAYMVVHYFRELNTSVKGAVTSIQELNSKVGIVIEKTKNHDNEIELLREKQDKLADDVSHIKAKVDVRG